MTNSLSFSLFFLSFFLFLPLSSLFLSFFYLPLSLFSPSLALSLSFSLLSFSFPFSLKPDRHMIHFLLRSPFELHSSDGGDGGSIPLMQPHYKRERRKRRTIFYSFFLSSFFLLLSFSSSFFLPNPIYLSTSSVFLVPGCRRLAAVVVMQPRSPCLSLSLSLSLSFPLSPLSLPFPVLLFHSFTLFLSFLRCALHIALTAALACLRQRKKRRTHAQKTTSCSQVRSFFFFLSLVRCGDQILSLSLFVGGKKKERKDFFSFFLSFPRSGDRQMTAGTADCGDGDGDDDDKVARASQGDKMHTHTQGEEEKEAKEREGENEKRKKRKKRKKTRTGCSSSKCRRSARASTCAAAAATAAAAANEVELTLGPSTHERGKKASSTSFVPPSGSGKHIKSFFLSLSLDIRYELCACFFSLKPCQAKKKKKKKKKLSCSLPSSILLARSLLLAHSLTHSLVCSQRRPAAAAAAAFCDVNPSQVQERKRRQGWPWNQALQQQKAVARIFKDERPNERRRPHTHGRESER